MFTLQCRAGADDSASRKEPQTSATFGQGAALAGIADPWHLVRVLAEVRHDQVLKKVQVLITTLAVQMVWKPTHKTTHVTPRSSTKVFRCQP